MFKVGQAALEDAFTTCGITVLQNTDGLAIYNYNVYPGGTFVIYWFNGVADMDAVSIILHSEGIDPQPILDLLAQRGHASA